jgi:hypothetical protein
MTVVRPTLKRCDGARIFGCSVERRPGQELHVAVVKACGHAKAVQFVDPLRS